MANEATPLFDFYLRYPWGPADFTTLQDSLVGIPRDSFAGLHAAGLLYGGVIAPSGTTLAVTVSAFSALNDSGYLCVKNSTQLVALSAANATNPRIDLIVARPSLVTDTTISRPTAPYDTVPLTVMQKCTVVAIAGTPAGSPVKPSKLTNDVILGSVTVPALSTSVSGGNINQTTDTEIGDCVRFASSAKNMLIIARDNGSPVPAIEARGVSNESGIKATGGSTGAGGVFLGGSVNGAGVLATGTGSDPGVYGQGDAGSGGSFLALNATSQAALTAENRSSGSTILAYASNGTGVGIEITPNATKAPLRIGVLASAPTGPNVVGDLYMTLAGILKVCVVAGSPGTWHTVGDQAGSTP